MTIEHIIGRRWLLFPGCAIHRDTAVPAGLDPATATHSGADGGAFVPVSRADVIAAPTPAPAKGTRRKAGVQGGGMFEATTTTEAAR